MSLIQASHDSLPYIDTSPSPSTRASITALLTSSLPSHHKTTLHPSLSPLPASKTTPLMQLELDRQSRSEPFIPGVDTSPYEALEPPSSSNQDPETLKHWHTTLQKAYTSSTHLSTRLTNLSLLEEFGKNAWLIHNSQLSDILLSLEQSLVNTQERVDEVNKERKTMQEDIRGEMEALEEAWRSGVGRVIEVEVAGEGVREEILGRRREGAK